MQVSSDNGVMLVAPFSGGKTGLMRELKKLSNVPGGVKIKVRRGQSAIEVRAKVVVDESSLLKKTYVLAGVTDPTHIATLVDAMEQECLILQGKVNRSSPLSNLCAVKLCSKHLCVLHSHFSQSVEFSSFERVLGDKCTQRLHLAV